MKTRFVIAALFFLFYSFANAQQKPRKWTVRVNTGTFIYITNVSIERAFAKRQSVSLLPSYSFFRSKQFTYETYGIGTEYRHYFFKKSIAPKGWYAAAGADFEKGTATIETYNNEKTDVKGFTTHLLVGYQWIFKKGLIIDVNGGGQYVKLDIKNPRYDGGYKGFLPGLGAGVGYSF